MKEMGLVPAHMELTVHWVLGDQKNQEVNTQHDTDADYIKYS